MACHTIANIDEIGDRPGGCDAGRQVHGTCSDDASLVLTESSYFDRLEFESAIDIKLRADTLGKSLLFVGYNLGDINIRYLLHKLHNCGIASFANSSAARARLAGLRRRRDSAPRCWRSGTWRSSSWIRSTRRGSVTSFLEALDVKIYYVTTNEFKIAEARDYVASHDVEGRLELSFLRTRRPGDPAPRRQPNRPPQDD